MRKKGKPTIKDSSDDWTKISFVPDLEKFGMEVRSDGRHGGLRLNSALGGWVGAQSGGRFAQPHFGDRLTPCASQSLDADTVALLTRRVYDMAGVTHHSVKVYLNGKRIAVNNFSNYVDLFLGPKLAPGRQRAALAPQFLVFDAALKRVTSVQDRSILTLGGSHRCAQLAPGHREGRRPLGSVRRRVRRRLPAVLVRQLDRDHQGRHPRRSRRRSGHREGAHTPPPRRRRLTAASPPPRHRLATASPPPLRRPVQPLEPPPDRAVAGARASQEEAQGPREDSQAEPRQVAPQGASPSYRPPPPPLLSSTTAPTSIL